MFAVVIIPFLFAHFRASCLRITCDFLGFAVIAATPIPFPFPVDTALNKKKNYNRRTQLVKVGTGGWLGLQETPETSMIRPDNSQEDRRNSRRTVSPGDYTAVMSGSFDCRLLGMIP